MKFEVFMTAAAVPYRFRIVSSKGLVLASSESYPTKAKAKRACESIQRGAAAASIVDLTE